MEPLLNLIIRKANGGDKGLKVWLLPNMNGCAGRCADFVWIDFFNEREARSPLARGRAKWVCEVRPAHYETVKEKMKSCHRFELRSRKKKDFRRLV